MLRYFVIRLGSAQRLPVDIADTHPTVIILRLHSLTMSAALFDGTIWQSQSYLWWVYMMTQPLWSRGVLVRLSCWCIGWRRWTCLCRSIGETSHSPLASWERWHSTGRPVTSTLWAASTAWRHTSRSYSKPWQPVTYNLHQSEMVHMTAFTHMTLWTRELPVFSREHKISDGCRQP